MRNYFPILLLSVALAACTTFHGLKPITPNVSDQTTSIRPTFKWNPSETDNVKYDFIVYNLVMKRSGLDYIPVAGETVYYREGIVKCEHTMEADLEPGKKYLWSVRVREGDKVGQWSLYDFDAYFVFGYVMKRNHLFKIKIVDSNAPKAPTDQNL